MIIFPKDKIKIYEEIQNPQKCGVDSYGKPLKCPILRDIVEGDLQNIGPSDSRYAFGTETSNTHTLYLNHDTKIESTDIIKVEGYKGYFEIVGEPQIYNKLLSHILVSLRHIKEGKWDDSI